MQTLQDSRHNQPLNTDAATQAGPKVLTRAQSLPNQRYTNSAGTEPRSASTFHTVDLSTTHASIPKTPSRHQSDTLEPVDSGTSLVDVLRASGFGQPSTAAARSDSVSSATVRLDSAKSGTSADGSDWSLIGTPRTPTAPT